MNLNTTVLNVAKFYPVLMAGHYAHNAVKMNCGLLTARSMDRFDVTDVIGMERSQHMLNPQPNSRMESLNPAINALHATHIRANSIEPALLPMNAAFERVWYDAIQGGITPEMLEAVIAYRLQRIKAGVRRPECVRVRNLVGSDEAIAETLEDWAFICARRRIRVVDPARASVLAATGRPAEAPTPPAKHVADLELIQALKKAVG